MPRILSAVYVISGFCAAVGGMFRWPNSARVAHLRHEQRNFGHRRGRAGRHQPVWRTRQVFPGTVLGAVLIQTVENGLVILNADPYLYPLVTSAIIFLAVFVDSLRGGFLGSHRPPHDPRRTGATVTRPLLSHQ